MHEQPQVPVNIGDVLLNKYVVERVIGAGGMGVVVAVRHRDLGELYAMKFMLPSALMNAEAVDRFVREARAAAKLKSEHVAKVHDVGRLENGSPYMVMEFLTGKDLEGVLAESGILSSQKAATYVLQACDAIAEAHEVGVVHRDLKPANLFLTKRANGSPCVKVLDFGISKTTTPGESASMTRTSAVMGSPYYMSPEQMRSSKNVDLRTDIWALGVILYQLTTGRVPFPGETITEVCSGVLSDDPPPLVNLIPGVSPEFDAIIRRCLQKKQEYRFSTARELAAALAPISGGSPGTSGLDLRSAGATAATVAIPMPTPPQGVGATTGQPGYMAQQSAGQPMPGGPGQMTSAGWGSGTQPTPKKSSAGIVVGIMAVVGIAAGGGVFYMKSQAGTGETKKAAAATAEPEATSKATAEATATSKPTATAEATATASAEATATASATASAEATAAPTAKPIAAVRTAATAIRTAATVKTTKPPVKPPTTTGGHGIF